MTMSNHRGVVCGVDFSHSGLLASGGNDGMLNIWDQRASVPVAVFNQHRAAAIKALAWHPTQSNVLASGGGSADRTLRLWDVAARRCFNWRDTRAQVTGVMWSKHTAELCTSHGAPNIIVFFLLFLFYLESSLSGRCTGYADDGSIGIWNSPALLRVARE